MSEKEIGGELEKAPLVPIRGATVAIAPLDFDQLREANVERCESAFHPLHAWSPADWMLAVTGEVGEAANLIKKRKRGEAISTDDIADELADAVIYLDLLAAALEIDLGEAVRWKFDVVSRRVGSRVSLNPPRGR